MAGVITAGAVLEECSIRMVKNHWITAHPILSSHGNASRCLTGSQAWELSCQKGVKHVVRNKNTDVPWYVNILMDRPSPFS